MKRTEYLDRPLPGDEGTLAEVEDHRVAGLSYVQVHVVAYKGHWI